MQNIYILGCVGATSCLDKYPGSSIPEKEAMRTFADAEQTLTGIYASLKSNALYSGYLTLLPDIQADLVYAVEGNTNTYGSFWRWDIRPTDLQLEAVYAALYKVIGNCNFYLDRIDEVVANEISDTNIEKLEQYTGEVYAVRALCYTELPKTFCKAYEPDTAQSELGVVLRTKYFTPEAARRASLYDSYQFVLDDLAEAEKRLDKENDAYGNVYMTSASAEALHARVALYMQDWDTAIEYSSTLIDEKKATFQLSDAKTNYTSGACPAIRKKEILGIHMPMTKDKDRLKKSHADGARILEAYLDQGKAVAFLTLGDPTVYSTYIYLHNIVKEAGYETEIVSGVTSFCAAAARLEMDIASKAQQIHIIPASYQIEEALLLPGTKVLMKAGGKLPEVKEVLKHHPAEVTMVENCGMEQERIYYGAEQIPEDAGYYTLLFVKEEGEPL